MSFEPPRVKTAASDDRAAAQEREAVGVNGLQDVLGGDGRGVCTHPHSLGDLLAEAYARGHGLGESGGDGSLRTIPLVRRAAEESLVENALLSVRLEAPTPAAPRLSPRAYAENTPSPAVRVRECS